MDRSLQWNTDVQISFLILNIGLKNQANSCIVAQRRTAFKYKFPVCQYACFQLVNYFVLSKKKVRMVICVLLCLEYLHVTAARTKE